MRTLRWLPFVLFACGLAACAHDEGQFRDGVFSREDVRYRIEPPTGAWREAKVVNTDMAWLHDDTAASLLVSSHCQGVEDAPLHVLTRHLMFGMTDREIVEQNTVDHSHRQAMVTQARAKLDGVERRLSIFVLKKDGCVYDVVMAVPEEHHTAVQNDFSTLISGLDVLPKRDR